MSAVCPNGHRSGSGDFCDVCGERIADEAVAAQPWEAVVWADRA